MKGTAPAFYVRGVRDVVRSLAEKRPELRAEVSEDEGVGIVATYEDPGGHMLFLSEPSERALEMPSGRKINQILSTPL